MAETAQQERLPSGVAIIEHLTGPARSTASWLSAPIIDVCLSTDSILWVTEARSEFKPHDVYARLIRADDSYEIQAFEDRPVWVNRERVISRMLKDGDMVEFGETGPLSRFSLYRDNKRPRPTVIDILRDAHAYVHSSRKPIASRLVRVVSQILRRLASQTTVLFRISVVIAVSTLGTLAYQQHQINLLLRQGIEEGATRLESVSHSLGRARLNALTPDDLQELRREFAGRMTSNAERLAALERRSTAARRVIASAAPSVLLLQGAYGFREEPTGRMLRYALGEDGRQLTGPRGEPGLTLEGDGPIAELQFTGTASAVGDGRLLITNRHVAFPWESDPGSSVLAQQGLEPAMIRFVAYRPRRKQFEKVALLRASETADLALLQLIAAMPPA